MLEPSITALALLLILSGGLFLLFFPTVLRRKLSTRARLVHPPRRRQPAGGSDSGEHLYGLDPLTALIGVAARLFGIVVDDFGEVLKGLLVVVAVVAAIVLAVLLVLIYPPTDWFPDDIDWAAVGLFLVRGTLLALLLVVLGSTAWLVLQTKVNRPSSREGRYLNFYKAELALAYSRIARPHARRSARFGFDGIREDLELAYGAFEATISVEFPTRVYEGDTELLLLEIRPSEQCSSALTLHSLRVEVKAPGVEMAGDRQVELAFRPRMRNSWLCNFSRSGDQRISIHLSLPPLAPAFLALLPGEGDAVALGEIFLRTRVVRFDHMTQRQLRMLGALAIVATIVGTLVNVVLAFFS